MMATDRTARPGLPLQRRVLKAVRSVFGDRSPLEKTVRASVNAAKFHAGRPIRRPDIFAWRAGPGSRFGVYAMGGCDLRSVVGAGPALATHFGGTIGMGTFGHAPETRSDVILQTLDPPPQELTREVTERLNLLPGYFEPRLFQPEFTLKHQFGIGPFPKDVVVLSVSSDVARTVYRHRTHGFLVDPGGWWLNTDIGSVLDDLDVVKWFAGNFRKAGRIEVDETMANFDRIISEVRSRLGAFVVMLNVLTVDPGRTAAEYRQANSPSRVRRRRFCLALTDLARRLDFPIIDVDRIVKEHGISEQVDFVHYTVAQKRAISRQFAALVAGVSTDTPDALAVPRRAAGRR